MTLLNVVWLRHAHVVVEGVYACFGVAGEGAPKVDVCVGPVVGCKGIGWSQGSCRKKLCYAEGVGIVVDWKRGGFPAIL